MCESRSPVHEVPVTSDRLQRPVGQFGGDQEAGQYDEYLVFWRSYFG